MADSARNHMTDKEWLQYQDQHMPEDHYEVWMMGACCNCEWWLGDLNAFEDKWWDVLGKSNSSESPKRADCIDAAIEDRMESSQRALPLYNVTYDVQDDDKYLTFNEGCPVCQYPETHSHIKEYVLSSLGEDDYKQIMTHINNTEKQNENIYRIRVLDHNRKLGVVRVYKGTRKDVIKRSMSNTINLLAHTRLPQRANLARCEPLVRVVRERST